MEAIYMAKQPKKKPKKKPKKMTAKEQSARFVQTAREVEADETGEDLERVFAKIVPSRRHKNTDK
jgi:hypothetical protein